MAHSMASELQVTNRVRGHPDLDLDLDLDLDIIDIIDIHLFGR